MGNRVYQKRKQMGMTQEELAQRTGIAQTTISAVERGQIAPNVYAAQRIAIVLKSKVEVLFPMRNDGGKENDGKGKSC